LVEAASEQSLSGRPGNTERVEKVDPVLERADLGRLLLQLGALESALINPTFGEALRLALCLAGSEAGLERPDALLPPCDRDEPGRALAVLPSGNQAETANETASERHALLPEMIDERERVECYSDE
jgi:hypothetical protein